MRGKIEELQYFSRPKYNVHGDINSIISSLRVMYDNNIQKLLVADEVEAAVAETQTSSVLRGNGIEGAEMRKPSTSPQMKTRSYQSHRVERIVNHPQMIRYCSQTSQNRAHGKNDRCSRNRSSNHKRLALVQVIAVKVKKGTFFDK